MHSIEKGLKVQYHTVKTVFGKIGEWAKEGVMHVVQDETFMHGVQGAALTGVLSAVMHYPGGQIVANRLKAWQAASPATAEGSTTNSGPAGEVVPIDAVKFPEMGSLSADVEERLADRASPTKNKSFGEQFNAARTDGRERFEHERRSFNTRLRGEAAGIWKATMAKNRGEVPYKNAGGAAGAPGASVSWSADSDIGGKQRPGGVFPTKNEELFQQVFVAARKLGAERFSFGENVYHTRQADETVSRWRQTMANRRGEDPSFQPRPGKENAHPNIPIPPPVPMLDKNGKPTGFFVDPGEVMQQGDAAFSLGQKIEVGAENLNARRRIIVAVGERNAAGGAASAKGAAKGTEAFVYKVLVEEKLATSAINNQRVYDIPGAGGNGKCAADKAVPRSAAGVTAGEVCEKTTKVSDSFTKAPPSKKGAGVLNSAVNGMKNFADERILQNPKVIQSLKYGGKVMKVGGRVFFWAGAFWSVSENTVDVVKGNKTVGKAALCVLKDISGVSLVEDAVKWGAAKLAGNKGSNLLGVGAPTIPEHSIILPDPEHARMVPLPDLSNTQEAIASPNKHEPAPAPSTKMSHSGSSGIPTTSPNGYPRDGPGDRPRTGAGADARAAASERNVGPHSAPGRTRDEAFAAARARGLEKFEYNGSLFHTQLAGESDAAWRFKMQTRRFGEKTDLYKKGMDHDPLSCSHSSLASISTACSNTPSEPGSADEWTPREQDRPALRKLVLTPEDAFNSPLYHQLTRVSLNPNSSSGKLDVLNSIADQVGLNDFQKKIPQLNNMLGKIYAKENRPGEFLSFSDRKADLGGKTLGGVTDKVYQEWLEKKCSPKLRVELQQNG